MQLVTGQFNDSFEPIMDGVANVTKNYAYWLNRKHIETHVITPSYPKYEDTCDFDIIRYFSADLPMRSPYRLGLPYLDFASLNRINRIPFDIVHAHCPFSSGRIALKIANRREIPIVATFHSKYYDDFLEALKSEHAAQLCLNRVIDFFNRVDVVWTVNKSTTDTLRSYGFKGEIDAVYNGTDIKPPEDISKAAESANVRLNIAPDDTVLLFVGQLIWQKNLSMLINSLYHLKSMGINYKMLIVGGGYAEDELKQLVESLGLQEYVQFLGVIRDREFLISLFARASLFLFPSLYDTSGIVIQEAAALKCPSLVIENSNVSEGIRDHYNGFLSPDDELSYAKKIVEALSQREHLKSVGSAAQRTLYRSWETVISEVKERYTDIVKTTVKVNQHSTIVKQLIKAVR